MTKPVPVGSERRAALQRLEEQRRVEDQEQVIDGPGVRERARGVEVALVWRRIVWLVHVPLRHVGRVGALGDDTVADESDRVGLGWGRGPELLLTVAVRVVWCRERIC